jgi:hypothetical protein
MVGRGACRMRRADLAIQLRRHINSGPFHSMTGPRAQRAGMGYAPFVSFPREDLALLGQTAEVEIETSAPAGPAHRTVVWIAVDGDDVFVRSYRGASARWYREAVANPNVALHVDGRRLTATATGAADPGSIERASDALARKYAGDPAVRAMVAPDTLPTTLRLVPA